MLLEDTYCTFIYLVAGRCRLEQLTDTIRYSNHRYWHGIDIGQFRETVHRKCLMWCELELNAINIHTMSELRFL
jgi:hypothetical protein